MMRIMARAELASIAKRNENSNSKYIGIVMIKIKFDNKGNTNDWNDNYNIDNTIRNYNDISIDKI